MPVAQAAIIAAGEGDSEATADLARLGIAPADAEPT